MPLLVALNLRQGHSRCAAGACSWRLNQKPTNENGPNPFRIRPALGLPLHMPAEQKMLACYRSSFWYLTTFPLAPAAAAVRKVHRPYSFGPVCL